jgi:hypothetical protein
MPCLGAKRRAPPRESSTVARSDERTRRWAASSVVPPPRSFRWTTALTRSLLCGRWRCEMKWGLGFGGARSTGLVLFARESCVTVHRGWTTHNLLDRMRPRWAIRYAAQAFAALWVFARGLGRTGFGLWASYGLSFSVKNFLFSEAVISLVN